MPSLTTAISPEAIEAAAQRYLGSFIARDSGTAIHSSFYHSRALSEITPDSITDEFGKALYMCLTSSVAEGDDFDFTPRSIAYRLIEQGYVTNIGKDMTQGVKVLTARLDELSQAGAKTIKEFRRVEALFKEKLLSQRAETAYKMFANIMQAINGKSYAEKLSEVIDAARAMKGEFVQPSRNLDSDSYDQFVAAQDAEFKAMVGQVMLTFPPEFGEIYSTIYPQRKELVTISGGSGGGKSILLHMIAEWFRHCGKRCLVILTEDSLEITADRAAARWVDKTTVMELVKGDKFKKRDVYKKMVAAWRERGGEIVYRERVGITGTELITLIDEECVNAQAQGRPFDAILIDYFTDCDFELDASLNKMSNATAAAARCAVKLKGCAVKHNCVVVTASQETGTGDDAHAYGSRRLQHKSQIWFRFERPIAEEQITLQDHYYGDNPKERLVWVKAGEEMPLMYLKVKKANRFKKGFTVPLFVMGARQMVYSPDYYRKMRLDPNYEFPLPVYAEPDDNFYRRQDTAFKIADLAVDQIENFDAYNPDNKRSRGAKGYIPG